MMNKQCLQWLPAAGLGLLLLMVFLVYFASLFHVARADQVTFLAEYAGRNDLVRMVMDSLYYNRTREFSPGDEALFRPLLFLMLSVQKALFGYGFFWWQAVALGAHLFTVAMLWRLLRRWAGDTPGFHAAAWVLTVFFAFLFVNMEAVIWHGITPYVFFAGFVLIALERLDVFVVSSGQDRRALTVCALWLLAAVLTYEAGVWYIPCFFVYALVSLRGTGRIRRAGVLLMPLMIYVVWSAGHWILTQVQPNEETARLVGGAFLPKTVFNFLAVLKWFVGGGFFLQANDVIPISRLIVRADVFAWPWPLSHWMPMRWLGVAAVLILIASIAIGAWFIKEKGYWRRLGLLGAMLTGYVLIIVVGRANTRVDGTGLECSLYYFYNFWTIFTVILFVLVRSVFARHWLWALAVSLPLMACAAVNSWSVSLVTSSIAREHHMLRKTGVLLDSFIAEHKKEPDFSFYVQPNEAGNYQVSWLTKRLDPPGKKYYYVETLYPQYFRADKPKYSLRATGQ